MIHVSAGTAAALGLKSIKMAARPTTAYLLRGSGCTMNCAFCPQSRESRVPSNRLGRVNWPAFPLRELTKGLKNAEESGIKRICLQGTRSEEEVSGFCNLLAEFKNVSQLPVCVSTWISNEQETGELLQAGAERVSIALDIASESAYARYKGGSLSERKNLLLTCAGRFPGRIATHLICGLGETEEEMIATIDFLLKHKVTVALFAFAPVSGTPLALHPQPEPAGYRRVQASYYLLREGLISFPQLVFKQGRLVSFGISGRQLQKLLKGGAAFRTSGCPDCNRPYYNEKPGGFIYNYPQPLTAAQETEALRCTMAGLRWE